MNVLSLFDGMSGARIALDRAGIKYTNYFTSEVDKYAIQVSEKNYPDNIQLGDVTKWKEWGLNGTKIDLLIAGFPCQSWSFSGKQKGLQDERGQLALVLVDIFKNLKKNNPDMKFLFENVKMKKENVKMLSELFGVDPIEINSSLLSAQNRKRLYWTNIVGLEHPEDKGIMLKDVLECGVVDRDKSYCLDANYYKGTNIEQYIKKKRRQIVFTKKTTEEDKLIRKEHAMLDECYNFRKLTPIECERLQNVPDNYTEGVSNTQRYKALGNGWTIDVIVHILKGKHHE